LKSSTPEIAPVREPSPPMTAVVKTSRERAGSNWFWPMLATPIM
jgi:hypothetical protein